MNKISHITGFLLRSLQFQGAKRDVDCEVGSYFQWNKMKVAGGMEK